MANIRNLLETSAEKYGNNIAFTVKVKKGEYVNHTYKEFFNDVRCLANGLLKKGITNKRIAVTGINSYEWILTTGAIYLSGNIAVPLDKEMQYGEFENSFIIGEMEYAFYDKKTSEIIENIFEEKKTKLVNIIPFNKKDDTESIYDYLNLGKKALDSGENLVDDVVIDDYGMTLLLFTSGTTSQAKGVMLSQNGIMVNIHDVLTLEDLRETDTNIALLPYHHIFGSTGQWAILAGGARTVYCDGLRYVQANLQEYGVSIFIGVPLLVDNMYKKVIQTAEKSGSLKKMQIMRKVSNFLLKFNIDIRRKVFKQVHEAFGGKFRMCIVGAAPVNPESLKGFTDLGILTIQGYGLTETSPILAAEDPKRLRVGSVGHNMPSVRLKIDNPDKDGIGEIIAKGPNVMLGYLNNEEATNEVLIDGWFHTGDLGRIDEDGYLFVTGRKKNVIVLKNGKNVFPEELETLVSDLDYVEECVVVGIPRKEDEKDLVVTLKVVYNKEYFTGKTKEEIEAQVNSDIDKINEGLPPYKLIKKVLVTDTELVKTTTAKVKRFIETELIKEELKVK